MLMLDTDDRCITSSLLGFFSREMIARLGLGISGDILAILGIPGSRGLPMTYPASKTFTVCELKAMAQSLNSGFSHETW